MIECEFLMFKFSNVCLHPHSGHLTHKLIYVVTILLSKHKIDTYILL